MSLEAALKTVIGRSLLVWGKTHTRSVRRLHISLILSVGAIKAMIDRADIQSIIEATVSEVLRQKQSTAIDFGGRITVTEREAADMLSVEHHVLRDARRRGEIKFSRIGKNICYTKEHLCDFLSRE